MIFLSAGPEKTRGGNRNLTTTGAAVSSRKLQLNKQNRETGVNLPPLTQHSETVTKYDEHWWALGQSVVKKERLSQSAVKANSIWSRDLRLESGLHMIGYDLHMSSLIHKDAKPMQ